MVSLFRSVPVFSFLVRVNLPGWESLRSFFVGGSTNKSRREKIRSGSGRKHKEKTSEGVDAAGTLTVVVPGVDDHQKGLNQPGQRGGVGGGGGGKSNHQVHPRPQLPTLTVDKMKVNLGELESPPSPPPPPPLPEMLYPCTIATNNNNNPSPSSPAKARVAPFRPDEEETTDSASDKDCWISSSYDDKDSILVRVSPYSVPSNVDEKQKGAGSTEEKIDIIKELLEKRVLELEQLLEQERKNTHCLQSEQTPETPPPLPPCPEPEEEDAQLDKERALREEAEARLNDVIRDNEQCRARLNRLQDDFTRLEELVCCTLQYRARLERLQQEKASIGIAYEARLRKYQNYITSLERENMLLLAEIKNLEASSKQSDDRERNLSKVLMERLRQLEVENSALVLEAEQYERCLDDVANQVVQALLTQKSLREECIKLQQRVIELEQRNRALGLLCQQNLNFTSDSLLPFRDDASHGDPVGNLPPLSDPGLGWKGLSSKGSYHSLPTTSQSPHLLASKNVPPSFHICTDASSSSNRSSVVTQASQSEDSVESLASLCSEYSIQSGTSAAAGSGNQVAIKVPGLPQLSSPPLWMRDCLGSSSMAWMPRSRPQSGGAGMDAIWPGLRLRDLEDLYSGDDATHPSSSQEESTKAALDCVDTPLDDTFNFGNLPLPSETIKVDIRPRQKGHGLRGGIGSRSSDSARNIARPRSLNVAPQPESHGTPSNWFPALEARWGAASNVYNSPSATPAFPNIVSIGCQDSSSSECSPKVVRSSATVHNTVLSPDGPMGATADEGYSTMSSDVQVEEGLAGSQTSESRCTRDLEEEEEEEEEEEVVHGFENDLEQSLIIVRPRSPRSEGETVVGETSMALAADVPDDSKVGESNPEESVGISEDFGEANDPMIDSLAEACEGSSSAVPSVPMCGLIATDKLISLCAPQGFRVRLPDLSFPPSKVIETADKGTATDPQGSCEGGSSLSLGSSVMEDDSSRPDSMTGIELRIVEDSDSDVIYLPLNCRLCPPLPSPRMTRRTICRSKSDSALCLRDRHPQRPLSASCRMDGSGSRCSFEDLTRHSNLISSVVEGGLLWRSKARISLTEAAYDNERPQQDKVTCDSSPDETFSEHKNSQFEDVCSDQADVNDESCSEDKVQLGSTEVVVVLGLPVWDLNSTRPEEMDIPSITENDVAKVEVNIDDDERVGEARASWASSEEGTSTVTTMDTKFCPEYYHLCQDSGEVELSCSGLPNDDPEKLKEREVALVDGGDSDDSDTAVAEAEHQCGTLVDMATTRDKIAELSAMLDRSNVAEDDAEPDSRELAQIPGAKEGCTTSWVHIEADVDLTDPKARANLLDSMMGSSSSSSSSECGEESEPPEYQHLHQLHRHRRHKKASERENCVLRYIRPTRPSILGRRDFFYRYGKQEQEAVASFDFLEDISTSVSDCGGLADSLDSQHQHQTGQLQLTAESGPPSDSIQGLDCCDEEEQGADRLSLSDSCAESFTSSTHSLNTAE